MEKQLKSVVTERFNEFLEILKKFELPILIFLILISIITYMYSTTHSLVTKEKTKPNKQIGIEKSINNIPKQYAFNINGQFIVVDRKTLYQVIYNYIYNNIKISKRNPVYISKLTNCYLKLMDDNEPSTVLRYIGLCKVESNFNNESLSPVGASGIPQVMLSVWKKVMLEKWNINLKQYHSDLYAQLIVGYKIYDICVKKNKGNLVKAHGNYSGNAKGYHDKVMAQHNIIKDKLYRSIMLSYN